ncbi:MAG TPA: hypothetical protein VGW77_29565 [Candidatus Binatia bacterium]|jgi:hypothetical protein|nr:hypothetical protein [Candidatus Binatia bacterium]
MDFNWAIQHKEIDGGSSANYWDTVKRRDHQYPEQDLLLAVLKDALLNYRKNPASRTKGSAPIERGFLQTIATVCFPSSRFVSCSV